MLRKEVSITVKRNESERFQSGIALVLVLFMLSVVSVLLIASVTRTQALNRVAAGIAEHARNRYAAEAAAYVALWNQGENELAQLTSSATPDNTVDMESEDDAPTFSLDGRVHDLTIGDVHCRIALADACDGFDPTSENVGDRLKSRMQRADSEIGELINAFCDSLGDYLDGDDFARLNGREASGYNAQSEGIQLPRNGPLQYVEEVLWIATPELVELLKSNEVAPVHLLRIFGTPAPAGVRNKPSFAGKPIPEDAGWFWQLLIPLTGEDAGRIASGWQNWRRDGQSSDAEDTALWQQIQPYIDTRSSGVIQARVFVERKQAAAQILELVCDTRRTAVYRSESRDRILCHWRWLLF